MKADLKVEIEILEGVNVTLDKGTFTVKGEKGEVTRKLWHPMINSKVEGNKILLSANKATQREKKLMFTYRSHLKNMMNGVKEGVIYKLKICSSHFPMTVNFNNGVLEVKNFIGERVPRTLSVANDVSVNVNGDEIVLEGNDKEKVGQTAASIETLTKRRGFDKRIFQDGIYIIEKNGKLL